MRTIAPGGALLAAAVVGCDIVPPGTKSAEPARADVVEGLRVRVTYVVDGDTFRAHTRTGREVEVRVLGVDTPETVDPDEPVECGGPAATRLARQLLTGRTVTLRSDSTQAAVDRYGRTLAYVETGGRDFAAEMVRRGAATEYTYKDAYRRQEHYRALEKTARARGAGLWGSCVGQDEGPGEKRS